MPIGWGVDELFVGELCPYPIDGGYQNLLLKSNEYFGTYEPSTNGSSIKKIRVLDAISMNNEIP